MKNKARLFLGLILLFVSCIHLFSQENVLNEEEKIDQIIKKLWSLSYGEWGNLSQTIKDIGDPILEPLIERLRKEDMSGWSLYKIEWHQRRIAWAIGVVRTEKAIRLLVEMLCDKTLHDYGRYEAAMALRKIKPDISVDPLIEVLNDRTSNPPPRFSAAYLLGDLKAEKALPSLIKALGEESNQIRMGAVYGLEHIGTDQAVKGLMQALKDGEGYIRRLTYSSLLKLRPEKKNEFLILAIKDEDWGVREDAVKALVEMGNQISGPITQLLKDKNSRTRWEAVRILSAIRLEGIEPLLLEGVRDSDWMVRNESAVALVRMKSSLVMNRCY